MYNKNKILTNLVSICGLVVGSTHETNVWERKDE